MRLGQQLGRADVQEEAGEEAEDGAEDRVRDLQDRADEDAGDRRHGDQGHPAPGGRRRACCWRAGSDTTPMPSLKRWMMTTMAMIDPDPATDRQAGGQGHAVEEAVDAHPGRADDAEVLVGRAVMVELERRSRGRRGGWSACSTA